jgi:hypothetical protein
MRAIIITSIVGTSFDVELLQKYLKGVTGSVVLEVKGEQAQLIALDTECPHYYTIDQGPDGVLCTDCGETVTQ